MAAGGPRIVQLDEVDPVMRFESRVFRDDDHPFEKGGRRVSFTDRPPVCPATRRAVVTQPHHCRAARLVITPPHRRRPHTEQPYRNERRRP
jgi:hypothetical protein